MRNRFHAFALIILLSVGLRGLAAQPSCDHGSAIYEMRDADVSPERVTCRIAGVPVIEGDAFAQREFWTVKNYSDALGIALGSECDGVKGLCITGSKKTCDTAWSVKSRRIRLNGKWRRYRLAFRVDTTIKIDDPGKDGEGWNSDLCWYGADGAKISGGAIPYSVRKGRNQQVAVCGDIPKGAVSFSVQLGFDWPNIGPENRVTFSELSFEELPDPSTYAPLAQFVSEIHAGGDMSWRADVPEGCSVGFQWRGAATAEAIVAKPFVGPDGTPETFFHAPFKAGDAAIQYRVSLRSKGTSTPALYEVSGNGWTDRNWTLWGDVRPPCVRRLSASPTRNSAEPLQIEISDRGSVVDWSSLKVSVDGCDRTSDFVRNGSRIALPAPASGWAQGLHTAEVCVADCHANKVVSRKMFYLGDAPTTPKVSLRDDGMTLIDGKPFFPIGLYAVCKRPFNGNSFDAAFKGLKDAGFNMAHTYGNPYDLEFLSAAAKYGLRLWVEARFPDHRFIETGRHDPSIIAWYLGDDTSDHILPELESDYDEAVKAVDPTRITVQADPITSSSSANSRYADYVKATDGFLPEIYPVRKEAGDASDRICVADVVRDMKLVAEDVRRYGDGQPRTCWPIIQYFKGWTGWAHFPTREQLFAMTFAAVIHGAHGITWYTYGGFGANEGVTSTPERWRNICDLAGWLAELAPVLVERTPPQPAAPEVTFGPKTDSHGNPSVTCLLKRHGGKTYLFAVNATDESVAAKLPAAGAEKAEVMHEYRTVDVSGGVIADGFAPFAVHIYVFKP